MKARPRFFLRWRELILFIGAPMCLLLHAPMQADEPGAAVAMPSTFQAVAKKGQVRVRLPKQTAWSDLELKKPYPLGAWLKTGRNSFAVIELSTGNRFRVLARTVVAVTADIRNPRVRKLQLASGRVEIELDRFPSGYQFRVETPTAVCGALGTRYAVAYEETATPIPGFFARLFGRKVREPEHRITCSRGTIFVESPAFEISKVDAGTKVRAVIHAGLENSFARVAATSGEADVRFSGSNRLHLTTDAEIESAHERGLAADLAAVRVRGKVQAGDGVELRDATFVLKNGAPYQVQGVRDYLVAAWEEGRLSTELTELQRSEGADPARIQALQEQLGKAAERATRLRRRLERRNMQRIIRQIRRIRPAPIRR